MLKKKYRVKGEHVNDLMEMEPFAYRLYVESSIKTFLIENGCSSITFERIKNDLKKCTDQLTCRKHLMFTQDFFLYLEHCRMFEAESKIHIKTRFFNDKNELCATHFLEA